MNMSIKKLHSVIVNNVYTKTWPRNFSNEHQNTPKNGPFLVAKLLRLSINLKVPFFPIGGKNDKFFSNRAIMGTVPKKVKKSLNYCDVIHVHSRQSYVLDSFCFVTSITLGMMSSSSFTFRLRG